MVTKTNWTLSSEATPQAIEAYLSDWKPDRTEKTFVIARQMASDFARRNAAALNEICVDGPCKLEDVTEGAVGYAQGFVDALDYIVRQLTTS